MSQENHRRCSSKEQEPSPTAQETGSSRDRGRGRTERPQSVDDGSEGAKDYLLSREDTAAFPQQTSSQEARGQSSMGDAITDQPKAPPTARSLVPEDAGQSPVLSQNGIRQAVRLHSTDTEAANTAGSSVTHTLTGHRARSSPMEHSNSLSGHSQHGKLQSYPSINSHSSKRSKSSSRSTASQIPSDAEEDCCVHCILACLFCQFLTLCNLVLDCATCGTCASDSSCCFCCGSEECAPCDLPCDLDCGIVDACCESADCLEICMECCGLCFSS
ncbi:myoD family inhibitor domain-containing protein isoform X1 [Hemiscyllium ocellatum]|uniref:myoD family inhibitor domain-containing protein isoform X1 n=1 Tax=Hemiscyllium ocellatum TaxID=170820 RepID=UPI002965FD8F|nr:myoD family inhibitor domain-containing protein isoform X1 [Hemiscyllium ocellatum]